MGLQVICERREQKKIGALQNCRILCYAHFGLLLCVLCPKAGSNDDVAIQPGSVLLSSIRRN